MNEEVRAETLRVADLLWESGRWEPVGPNATRADVEAVARRALQRAQELSIDSAVADYVDLPAIRGGGIGEAKVGAPIDGL